MGEYVSDVINDDYKEWRAGQAIFLTSPTGSGKTTFILERLVPYACKENRHILYLVNRKILKEQLETKIKELTFLEQAVIEVKLYQSLENVFKRGQDVNLTKYAYIVCDEAHYFSSDSLYNTNTELVYRKIVRDCRFSSVIIYISATFDFVKERIEREHSSKVIGSAIYGYPTKITRRELFMTEFECKTYSIKSDFSFLEYHIVNNIDDIYNEIYGSRDKWLVFVDSIEKGRELESNLKKCLKLQNGNVEDVSFLDSGYKKNDNNLQVVNNIVQSRKQTVKVLICTSVMDNGISLEDIELRNIVINADIKDEFIQMLGRKRATGEKTQLYIVKKTKNDINRRLNHIVPMEAICRWCLSALSDIEKRFKECDSSKAFDTLNSEESRLIYYQHSEMLSEIVNENNSVVQKVFYAFKGTLLLNFFAVKRVEYLGQYYRELLKQLEHDDNALIKRQLSWLGVGAEEAEEIIVEETKTKYQKCKERIIAEFTKVEGNVISEQELKDIKKLLKTELEFVVKENGDVEGAKTVLDNLGKVDRVLSSKNVKWLMENCGIYFDLKSLRDRMYQFISCE